MEKGIWIAKTWYIEPRWKYNSKYIFLGCKRTGREEKRYPSYSCPGGFVLLPPIFNNAERYFQSKSCLFVCKLKNKWKSGSRLRSEICICTFMYKYLFTKAYIYLRPPCPPVLCLQISVFHYAPSQKMMANNYTETGYFFFPKIKHSIGCFWEINIKQILHF